MSPQSNQIYFVFLLVFAITFASCSALPVETAPPPVVEELPPAPEEQAPSAQPATEAPPVEEQSSVRPDWHYTPLTNAVTGEAFTLADYKGQVVIVETMAVWCPLCISQQLQIQAALGELGSGFAAVSLDVDPHETREFLAGHVNSYGLGWPFAIAGNELSATLQAEFGPQVLSPPSTPVFLIGPDGRMQLAPFGIKDAQTLVGLARSMAQ